MRHTRQREYRFPDIEDTIAEMSNDANGDQGGGNFDEVPMGGVGEGGVAAHTKDLDRHLQVEHRHVW